MLVFTLHVTFVVSPLVQLTAPSPSYVYVTVPAVLYVNAFVVDASVIVGFFFVIL